MYLTLWMDTTSFLCMYTMIQTRTWSTAHIKAGCWYIDCGKVFCPIEEEDAKKACIQVDSKGAALGPNQGEEQEDEVEVNINLLLEKERNKILLQRKQDAKKMGFLFFGSLLSTNTYFMQHKAFPKEWVDMKAFLKKVFPCCCELSA